MKVTAFRVEMLVLDFDGIGEQEVISVIEDTRYPNRCISPDVKRIDAVEIDWSDDHPLNRDDTADAEYRRLFERRAIRGRPE